LAREAAAADQLPAGDYLVAVRPEAREATFSELREMLEDAVTRVQKERR
jgi:RNase P protein component